MPFLALVWPSTLAMGNCGLQQKGPDLPKPSVEEQGPDSEPHTFKGKECIVDVLWFNYLYFSRY